MPKPCQRQSGERPALRWLSRILAIGMICTPALVALEGRAQAFELFGFKLFGSDEDEDADIADPLRYGATLTVEGDDSALDRKLRAASSLLADAERPVSGSLGLLTKARSDRERLVAALYEEARYDGVVTITIAGQDLDAIPPDAQFGAEPVPVTITIAPGQMFTLGDVALKGDAANLSPAEFDLVPGGDASSDAVLKAEAAIVRRLRQEGRPLAAVTSREVVADHKTATLDVSLTLAAGPIAGFGETTVEGTEDVDRDFVAYMTGLKRGKTYSPEELEDARERLQALGVFNSVAVREAAGLDADGNIPVTVNVTERKKRYYGVGATVSNTDGLGLEGYWGHRNLFGKAEKLRIEGSISGIGDTHEDVSNPLDYVKGLNYNAGIMFEKPGVIGPASRFFVNSAIVLEHPDAYDRFSVKGGPGLDYDISKTQSVSGEFVVDYSKITDAFEPDREFLIVSTPLQYVFDNRDNKLNPTKGFRLLAYGEPSYDTIGGTPFLKMRGEGATYLAFDKAGKFVAAGRATLGSIVGAELEEIPANRRFYAGGGGSVRGYAYQGIGPKDPDGIPIGGLSLAEASAELRFAVTENFGLVPFVDAGTVSVENFPDFTDVKVGAGVGIRYLTPFGPLRVDGAVPLNPDPDDPDFGIYAGIGQAF